MDEAFLPDTKDWTWVLQERCPQCGLDAQAYTGEQIRRIAPEYVRNFRTRLEGDPAAGDRPDPGTWSALEYGAHLRDVCGVFRSRVRTMLLHIEPSYADWDQNRAAVEGRYSELAPEQVAVELKHSAEDLLSDVHAMTAEEYQRTGRRSDGYIFTVTSLLQYFLHELVHHWWDVSGERITG